MKLKIGYNIFSFHDVVRSFFVCVCVCAHLNNWGLGMIKWEKAFFALFIKKKKDEIKVNELVNNILLAEDALGSCHNMN